MLGHRETWLCELELPTTPTQLSLSLQAHVLPPTDVDFKWDIEFG